MNKNWIYGANLDFVAKEQRLLEYISWTTGGAQDLSELINFDFCFWNSADIYTNHTEVTGKKPAITLVWFMNHAAKFNSSPSKT